jgi:hypothetical protein
MGAFDPSLRADMKRNNSFRSTAAQLRTQQNSRRRWIVATLLAAAVTASPIGLGPTASAKGIVLPRDTCVGPQIAAQTCTKPPQPVPAHTLSPHGSRHRKIEIALAQEASGGSPEEGTNSTTADTP